MPWLIDCICCKGGLTTKSDLLLQYLLIHACSSDNMRTTSAHTHTPLEQESKIYQSLTSFFPPQALPSPKMSDSPSQYTMYLHQGARSENKTLKQNPRLECIVSLLKAFKSCIFPDRCFCTQFCSNPKQTEFKQKTKECDKTKYFFHQLILQSETYCFLLISCNTDNHKSNQRKCYNLQTVIIPFLHETFL